MSERVLIKRIKRASTQAGRPVIHLFANSRQQYPELVLFELSDLMTVGIDPTSLGEEEIPARFWAHFEYGTSNTAGNPYKDILHLEPINAPASTTSTDTSAIVTELRAIKALLVQVLQPPSPEPAHDPYPIGNPVADEPSNETTGAPPDPNGDREIFYTRTAKALADGIPQATIDALLDVAGRHGFALATECLAAENARKPGKGYDHRAAIVARLQEMITLPVVASGQVKSRLESGWEWTWSKAALLAEGKRLKGEMEGGKE